MELKAISRCFRFCALACLMVFGLAASEHHGLVKFGTLPVPGATVTATKDDKKVVAITDDNGIYSFPELEDGVWNIKVEMLTFGTLTKEVGIAPNAPGAEWELKMMSMDEIKPGLQAAPAVTPPPTGVAAPATAAGTPTPATGTPAAAPTPTAAATTPAKGKGKNAAPTGPQPGFQRTDVNASSDSAALASAPSISAPADPNASPSDAMVVNGSTSNGIERRAIGNGRKGPRSMYSGGLGFTNFENDLLDARSYSVTGEQFARTPETIFTFLANVQGPLYIPHVFRWTGNFGVNFQTLHSRRASNQQTVMPTQAERTGDFSQVTNRDGSPITVTDPTTGLPFPNGLIPSPRISSQAKYLLGYYPMPQFTALPGSNYNYEVPLVTRNSSNQLLVNFRKPLDSASKYNLTGTITYANAHGQPGSLFGFVDTNNTSNYGARFQVTHNFTRTTFANLQVNLTRSVMHSDPFFSNKTNVSGLAGITGNDQTPVDWGPPSLTFTDGSSMAGLSDGSPSDNRIQTLDFSGSVTYIRRPHTFTFTGDFKLQQWDLYSQNNGRGGFSFTGATNYGFASFLLGIPDAAQIAFGNADKYERARAYAAQFDDDWRVNSSFSLHWALRWDYGTPITEKYGRLVNMDIGPGFTSPQSVIAYSPIGPTTGYHYPDSLVNPDKHEVQPRLGIAWKPIFGSSLLIRGGYGVYYNPSIYNGIASNMLQQYPLSKNLNVVNSAASPLTLANGFIGNPLASADTYAVDPNFRIGYMQMWNLSAQQSIGSIVLVASYIGNRGSRAAQAFQPNTYPLANWANPSLGTVVTPCPTCLAGYTYFTSNGNSVNNAGSLNVRRRFHSGLQSAFSYTYAKAIDDVGSGLGSSSASIAQNWLNLAGERGRSSFDQRHKFTANFQYSTGVGIHGGSLLSGWRGLLIKGWTITSTLSLGSGLPITPAYSAATPQTGLTGTIRPEYIGGDPYAGAAGRFLNAAAFGIPLPGQWGDVGRGSLSGPNQFSLNGSMARAFADHISLTLSATNILNHPVPSGWISQFNPALANGGTFGTITNMGGMRTVNATVRWTF